MGGRVPRISFGTTPERITVHYTRRERAMNKEYLTAKAQLTATLAAEDLKAGEIERAIKNLERANRAMARLFNLEEEENE